jgi:hypothetical protein
MHRSIYYVYYYVYIVYQFVHLLVLIKFVHMFITGYFVTCSVHSNTSRTVKRDKNERYFYIKIDRPVLLL